MEKDEEFLIKFEELNKIMKNMNHEVANIHTDAVYINRSINYNAKSLESLEDNALSKYIKS
ncbi:11393_t:CDS:1 [Dentiscutata erythropus]|uniref:11393_t:CDS:1 n=1 Tax=Dentiscutata erythropus TaxID=1348616 RepID=A0A9N9KGX0_9GLOM|nr:11393_t:CDS:1 [Dentiscutata erythropus]